jgi:putative transposase
MTAEAVEAVMHKFKKAVIERALGGEMTHQLGYAPGAPNANENGNHRNGTSAKTALTDDGAVRIDVPRDRQGTFEPQLIGKHERRFIGFDDKIIAMYARGMTVREVQAFLLEMYCVEVSPEFISSVTDAVMREITAWQARPLEPCTRLCSSTPCGSISGKMPWCATRRFTWRCACYLTARATSWVCG